MFRQKLDTKTKEASYKPQNSKVSVNVDKKTQSGITSFRKNYENLCMFAIKKRIRAFVMCILV